MSPGVLQRSRGVIGKDNGCMLPPGLCKGPGNEVRGDRMFRQVPIEAIGRFVGTLLRLASVCRQPSSPSCLSTLGSRTSMILT